MGTTSHTLQPKVGSDMTQDTHVDDIRPLGPPALRDIPHAPDLTPEHSSLAIQIVDSGSPITMIFPVEADVPDAATAPDSTDIPPGDLDTTVKTKTPHPSVQLHARVTLIMFKKVAEKKTKTTHPSVQILAPVTQNVQETGREATIGENHIQNTMHGGQNPSSPIHGCSSNCEQAPHGEVATAPHVQAQNHPKTCANCDQTTTSVHNFIQTELHSQMKNVSQTLVKQNHGHNSPPPSLVTHSPKAIPHHPSLIIFSQHTLEFPIQKFSYTYSHTPPSLVPHSHQNTHSHLSQSFGKPKPTTHSSHPLLHHPFTNSSNRGPYHQLSFH
ncbi:hypothetical protein WN943_005683 [Citrus x changshan-huyou]